MRLHLLEVEGFGPFRERQIVDFDAFAEDGIFLIGGRTGAGKSSILDAVCYGLYGGVPRYEGGEKRLRSDHSGPGDDSAVVVEFSTTAGRFRVTRTPDYQAIGRNGRERIVKASALLEERVDGAWRGRAARLRDVAHELDGILQLNQQQFLQVILLAQNRFARFLLADSKERRDLLRKLFGTERFEDLQMRFEERRRLSEHTLAGTLVTVQTRVEEAERLVVNDAEDAAGSDGASVDERLRLLDVAQDRVAVRAAECAEAQRAAEERMAAADRALQEARERRKRQDQRQEAERERVRLGAADAENAETARQLENARAAELLRAPLEAMTRTAAAQETARSARDGRQKKWEATGVVLSDLSAEALRAWAAEQTRRSGSWQRAAEWEAHAAERAAERTASQSEVDAIEAQLSEIENDRAELPERIGALTEERDAARRLADAAPAAAQEQERAKNRRRAAADVLRITAAQQEADRELAAANATFSAAQQRYTDLQQRRLDGYAGELANTLVEGEPCAVCGAISHPAPAVHADPVSSADVEQARERRDAAAAAERNAQEKSAKIREQLAAQVSRAEGRSLEQAQTEEERAREDHDRALSAATHAAKLDEELGAASVRATRIEEERQRTEAARAEARERLAVLIRRDDDADKEIHRAREGYPSVAARVVAVADQITAAGRFADAVEEGARREEAFADAARACEEALADSPFTSAEQASAALRSPAAQATLEESLAAHRAAKESVRTVLAQFAAEQLPDELIDLSPFTREAEQRKASWLTAVTTATAAHAAAESLAALIASARDEHARSAAHAEAHAALRELADAISGRGANTRRMSLETFVLAAELEDIVESANRRLHEMSTGRYQLRYSDALAAHRAASGLGIVVLDAFTGQERPAQSLSGGETFLASLALALGLSEVVTSRSGGIQLDTLFIDEGFGSLDADTLDIAMRTLDELRQGGRTVGVISHVEAMQEQIPAQLRVMATPEGPSVIRS